jgi:hypothetical protein
MSVINRSALEREWLVQTSLRHIQRELIFHTGGKNAKVLGLTRTDLQEQIIWINPERANNGAARVVAIDGEL